MWTTRATRQGRKRRKITARLCHPSTLPYDDSIEGGGGKQPHKTKHGRGSSPADTDIKDDRVGKDNKSPSTSYAIAEQRRAPTTQRRRRTWMVWQLLTTEDDDDQRR